MRIAHSKCVAIETTESSRLASTVLGGIKIGKKP